MLIGEKIKKLRESKKMSQDDLAKELHVSYQAVSNWERGKSYPDRANIIIISDLYNISLDELIREDKNYKEVLTKNKIVRKYNLQNVIICFGILVVVPSMIFLSNSFSLLGLMIGFSVITGSEYIANFIKE